MLALLLAVATPADTAALAPFDGAWRGTATITLPGGKTRRIVQTERVGPLLNGAVRVIEGKSYEADGTPADFNALGIVSATPEGHEFRAYAQGHAGTFPMTLAPGRFDWSRPAGPGAAIHFTATAAGGKWHEEGWYERDGKRVAKTFDATLERIGEIEWPAGNPIPAR